MRADTIKRISPIYLLDAGGRNGDRNIPRLVAANAKLNKYVRALREKLDASKRKHISCQQKRLKVGVENDKLLVEIATMDEQIQSCVLLKAKRESEDLISFKSPEKAQIFQKPNPVEEKPANRSNENWNLSNVSVSTLSPEEEAALLESPQPATLDAFSGCIRFEEKVSSLNQYFSAYWSYCDQQILKSVLFHLG